jgi:predicted TIM-barrel fold metal-dependent hydrolase
MIPMKLFDAHHHLWNLQVLEYKWLKQIGVPKPFGDPTPIQKDYLTKNFLNDVAEAADIELAGSVHIQVDGALFDPVTETSWLSKPDPSGIPSAIVGFVNLTKEDAEAVLKRHLSFPKFRGVRQIIGMLEQRPDLSFTSEHLLRNPQWQENFVLLEKHQLSFELQLYPEQMTESADFLSGFPEVPVVIDHAGCPYDQSESGLQLWREGLASLAELPNLHIKLSGFGMYDKDWSSGSAQVLFETILELFGPKRIMWGSNFPVDRLMKPYNFCVEQLLQWISPLPLEDQRLIASETAKKFYRIVERS